MLTVILNCTSGRKPTQALTADLSRWFYAAGATAQIIEVASIHHAADVVRNAVARGAEAVVAAGGDGTISAVASVLAGGPVPLGVLPLGTFNHFARDLDIPLDLHEAVETIVRGRRAQVDVGRVNERTFINNTSIGVYPDIVERREALRHDGYRKWPALARATLQALRLNQDIRVRLAVGGSELVFTTPFVFVGNNEYRVEGVGLGSRSRVNEGRLYAYFAPPAHTRGLPALLLKSLIGRAKDRTLDVVAATDLWVETLDVRRIHAACDGEVVSMTTPLHFTVWPAALTVLA